MTTQVDWVLLGVKATINSLHDEGQTWRKIAETTGVSQGLIHHIAHGKFEHASWDTIRSLSLHLSQIDPGPLNFVLACPSCGGAHTVADCHGAPVAAVVGLAPGETIKRPGKARARRTYFRPCLALDLTERIPQLRALLAEAEAAKEINDYA